MKAKDAQVLSKQAEKRHQDLVSAQREAEYTARKREDDHYMRTEYHKFETKVYSDIKKAANSREKSIIVRDPVSVAWNHLEKQLRADGYAIQADYIQGHYTNYGDSEAPCNVWTDSHWNYIISW